MAHWLKALVIVCWSKDPLVFIFLEHFLCRFNETEQLLKELQTAHILLTKQSDSLKKTHDALQLQHHR